jgi:hypothetical protein
VEVFEDDSSLTGTSGTMEHNKGAPCVPQLFPTERYLERYRDLRRFEVVIPPIFLDIHCQHIILYTASKQWYTLRSPGGYVKLLLSTIFVCSLHADTILTHLNAECDDGVFGVANANRIQCSNGSIASEAELQYSLSADRSTFEAFAFAGTFAFRPEIDDLGTPRESAESFASALVIFNLRTFGPERMGIIHLTINKADNGFNTVGKLPRLSGQYDFTLGVPFSGETSAFGEDFFDGIDCCLSGERRSGLANLRISLVEADGVTVAPMYFLDEHQSGVVPEPATMGLAAIALGCMVLLPRIRRTHSPLDPASHNKH